MFQPLTANNFGLQEENINLTTPQGKKTTNGMGYYRRRKYKQLNQKESHAPAFTSALVASASGADVCRSILTLLNAVIHRDPTSSRAVLKRLVSVCAAKVSIIVSRQCC